MSALTRGAVAVLAAVAVGCGGRSQPAGGVSEVATPEPVVMSTVTLFFAGEDGLLEREAREVADLPEAGPPRIRVIVAELLAGSHDGRAPVIPWPATLHAAFVDRSGCAYLDLSAPPRGIVEGTATETALIYGLVHSVVTNCPGVERVQLLFDGSEVTSLGHIDLSRPLAPRPELVAP
jgi:hypothetical protein